VTGFWVLRPILVKYHALCYLSPLAMKTCLCTIQTVAVIVALVGCNAQTKVYTTPNSSMEPTLLQGEKFAAGMQPFQPSRGDLVIFRHEGIPLVERVIGISGDTVEGHNLQVFVNGKEQHEPYIQHLGNAEGTLDKFGPMRVTAGQLFVMGDNRDYSFDSRDPQFGSVSVSDVTGRPIKVVVSPDSQRVRKMLQ
jgi:signal peptidase I